MKNYQLLTSAAILLLLSATIADKAQAESNENKDNDKNLKQNEQAKSEAGTNGTIKKIDGPLVTVAVEGRENKIIYVSEFDKYRWGLSKGLKVVLINNKVVGVGEDAKPQEESTLPPEAFMFPTTPGKAIEGTVKKIDGSIVTVKFEDNPGKDIYVTEEEKSKWKVAKGLKVAVRSNRIVGAGEDALKQDTDFESATNFMNRVTPMMDELRASISQ